MKKRTVKVKGLVDWSDEAKRFIYTTTYSYNVYCTIKKALEECGLERVDDGCLSTYKMGGVSIDFDPTWGSLTLSAKGVQEYEISYLHSEKIVECFFEELRGYWRRYEDLNRSS